MIHKSLPFFVLFFLLLQPQFLVMGDRKLIENTCRITEYYDLCISTLLSNPTSLKTDLKGLTLILLGVLQDKGSETIEKIKSLNESNPEWDEPLYECYMNYNAVVKEDVPEAITGVNEGRPQISKGDMMDISIKSLACDEGFMRRSMSLPLTTLNTLIYNLAFLTANFIGLL
ncbi:hypothetical protein L2E82_27893 [Cichorium intybus]|uniref:Uncharacterized protein n=1 Tax=Cichorium intybus TaxID=13427 RepID=A0ACB9CUL2_CICIN|nr:hypothetical protein L2E82_27893 [Cichorium intybus]